jgi:hypothetical protein
MNHHNIMTVGMEGDGTLTLPRERGQGKEISLQHRNPSKKAQQKAISKAGQLVDY